MTIHVGDAGAPLVPSGWWVMGVTLCVRPGDYGTVVAVSGEIDVCMEGPVQQVLLRIMRERGARLLLDLSGVSFMDCAGLRPDHRPDRDAGGLLLGNGAARIVRQNSFKPNGPDTTRRRKCDAAQVFRISAEGPRRKPYEWGM
jgi:hypothetical protein